MAAVPELEVTDGWYRLRATVDPPLARAISRGVVRVGRKIAVAGAKVNALVLFIILSHGLTAVFPLAVCSHT